MVERNVIKSILKLMKTNPDSSGFIGPKPFIGPKETPTPSTNTPSRLKIFGTGKRTPTSSTNTPSRLTSFAGKGTPTSTIGPSGPERTQRYVPPKAGPSKPNPKPGKIPPSKRPLPKKPFDRYNIVEWYPKHHELMVKDISGKGEEIDGKKALESSRKVNQPFSVEQSVLKLMKAPPPPPPPMTADQLEQNRALTDNDPTGAGAEAANALTGFGRSKIWEANKEIKAIKDANRAGKKEFGAQMTAYDDAQTNNTETNNTGIPEGAGVNTTPIVPETSPVGGTGNSTASTSSSKEPESPKLRGLANSIKKLMKDEYREDDRPREQHEGKTGGTLFETGAPKKPGDTTPRVVSRSNTPDSFIKNPLNIGPTGGTRHSSFSETKPGVKNPDWEPEHDEDMFKFPNLWEHSPPTMQHEHTPEEARTHMQNSIEKSLLKLMQ